MQPPPIRAAGPADEAGVIRVITLAFSADPMVRWAIPEHATYLAVMPEIARAFGGSGFTHGTISYAADGAGAAMWLPPGAEPDVERLIALFEQNAPPAIVADLMAVFERMSDYHPQEPHWYLPLIGVDPARHGRGLGSALIRYALQRCDDERRPAYLESSNPRNIPLYERHGFEILGKIQTGASPTLTPMLRLPRS